jgi:hypothetical protein
MTKSVYNVFSGGSKTRPPLTKNSVQGSVGKMIRTQRVGRLKDAVKSSGRLEDKLKNRYGKEQSIYVELQSIRIGGIFPSGLSTVKKRLAIKTIATQKVNLRSVSSVIKIILQQNHSAAKSFCHRSHLVAKLYCQ